MYLEYAEKQLADIKNHSADSKGAAAPQCSARGPGANVVVHSGAHAHDAAHTNQVMYSCGSLAVKARKGKSITNRNDLSTQVL